MGKPSLLGGLSKYFFSRGKLKFSTELNGTYIVEFAPFYKNMYVSIKKSPPPKRLFVEGCIFCSAL